MCLSQLVVCVLPGPSPVRAQQAPTIAAVVIEQEGRVVIDPQLSGLIETKAGAPLSMSEVRDSIAHLTALGRFDDVRVMQEMVGNEVRLRYVLYPLHPVDRFELEGMLGLSAGTVRRDVIERFGTAPPAARMSDVIDLLHATYRGHGYPDARITARLVDTHDPDRATMVIDVEAGRRAVIEMVTFEEANPAGEGLVVEAPEIVAGVPYDAEAIERALRKHVDALKARGYYEARASHTVAFTDGRAAVRVDLQSGPHVSIVFAGDPLPKDERDRLVPVRAEGSADEDLLEDASRGIEAWLHAQGYRDARAPHTRTETPTEVTITFEVSRGPRYLVATVDVAGNIDVPTSELAPPLRIQAGEPFVESRVEAAVAAIRNLYLSRGYTQADITPDVTVLPARSAADGTRRVAVTIRIVEGARAVVQSVMFRGNTVLADAAMRALLTLTAGEPFSQVRLVTARDAIELEYRNLGYESVLVQPDVRLAADRTGAAVTFAVTEGPRVLVDHIIILGNDRTSAKTIERELLLHPGEPLGYTARLESQQRLSALGLFRRVSITEAGHPGDTKRDVLVQVEEAPPTTIGYGGGVQVGTRLGTDATGQAEERFEIVPRGFFEIGRRNMWGKNRSVNLFTRLALRSSLFRESNTTPSSTGGSGFNEYRVYGTFREPRVFNTRADLLLTGILDQAVRSSFNFRTREVRAETGVRLSPRYSLAGRYSFEHTELFNERFDPETRPLIDKVFPQVRLSKFSGTFIRDGRDDPIDPSRGRFVVVDAELAGRAIGSEVGFAKTYLQGFSFSRLPMTRRMIVALGARVGLARGFPRMVTTIGDDGVPREQVVQDLPASERFFAGGDTTVRGFTLDRLGTAATITREGFPTGGNGVIVLNGELRASMFGPFQGVVFLDAGNVFLTASELDVTDLRASAGFGIRYRSPVGPIRADLGFKLDRRELSPGHLERGYVLHISLGQAF